MLIVEHGLKYVLNFFSIFVFIAIERRRERKEAGRKEGKKEKSKKVRRVEIKKVLLLYQ